MRVPGSAHRAPSEETAPCHLETPCPLATPDRTRTIRLRTRVAKGLGRKDEL